MRRKCTSFAPSVPAKYPGLVLLVSPSLRQSRELFAKVIGFLKELEPVEQLEEDNKSSCTLANGARIVSLPGDPDTVRGFSAPKLIIKDEAAYISDAMQAAIDPMLAVSEGRLIEMSSPNGRRGDFYENWQHGEGVERIKIVGRQSRASPPSFSITSAASSARCCLPRSMRANLSMRSPVHFPAS